MGRAYKDEEKIEIRKRLLESGLQAFYDDSFKSFNIREIVKKAGISQGGFYNFYKDKNEFIIDTIKYRANEKIKLFQLSSESFSEYVSDILFRYLVELKHNADERKIYFELLEMLIKYNDMKNDSMFKEWLNEIIIKWNKDKLEAEVDINGLTNVIKGAIIFILNSPKIDPIYFDEIFKNYIQSNVLLYVKEK